MFDFDDGMYGFLQLSLYSFFTICNVYNDALSPITDDDGDISIDDLNAKDDGGDDDFDDGGFDYDD